MSLSGWDSTKKYKLTFDSSLVDSDLTDFVVPVLLGSASGKTNFDMSAVFSELGANSKKIAFEIGDTGVQCYGEIVSWDTTNKTAHIDIKIPAILAAEDMVLNLYYDSAHADNDTMTVTEASDDFAGVDGDAPNSQLWVVTNASGGTSSLQNNTWQCQLTQAGMSTIRGIYFIYGDFDIQVDFGLITAANQDLWFVGLRITAENLMMKVDFRYDGGKKYFSESVVSGTHTYTDGNSTSDTNGKFRITRVGSTVTTYQWNGSDWVQVHQCTGNTNAIKVDGSGYLSTNQTFVFSLDNLIVNSADYISGIIGHTNSHPSDIVHADRAFISHQARDPSGTAPQILDSSPNAKHGTSYGAMTSGDLIDGLTGRAIEYDGVDDYINHGYDAAHDITDLLTIRAVIKPSTLLDSGLTYNLGIISRQYDPTDDDDNYALFINSDGRLHLGSYGGSIQSTKDSWAADVPFVVHTTYNATGLVGELFVDGVKEVLTNDTLDSMVSSANNLVIGKHTNADNFFPGSIDEVLILNEVVSDAWVAVDNAALRDALITFSEVVNTILVALGQPYNLSRDPVLAALDQEYHMTIAVKNSLSQIWAMILEQSLVQHYGNADQILAALTQHYHDAPQVQRALVQKYDDMVQLSAALEQKYNMMFKAEAALVQEWAICGTSLSTALIQEWDLSQRNEIIAALGQYWCLFRDSQDVQAPLFWVMADGVLLNPSEFTWTRSAGSVAIQATVALADQGAWRSIQLRGSMEIHWNGITYGFFIEEKTRARSITADKEYRVDYLLHGLSMTAGLEAPYANPVSMEWTQNTMASVIVADLADGIPVDWKIADFPVYANTFSVDNETPLSAIKRLVGSDTVRAVVQSSHDGNIVIRRNFPKSPVTWHESVADHVISDDGGVFSDSDNRDVMPGYNSVEISNQEEADSGKRLQEENISATSKRVRGYSVPWEDDFPLVTSGGDWVDVVNNGIISETIHSELVEFVDGAGSLSNPVYSDLELIWLQDDLGTVSAAEDGSLISGIVGNSLAKITYLTKYREWIVHDQQIESVQVFIPDEEAV